MLVPNPQGQLAHQQRKTRHPLHLHQWATSGTPEGPRRGWRRPWCCSPYHTGQKSKKEQLALQGQVAPTLFCPVVTVTTDSFATPFLLPRNQESLGLCAASSQFWDSPDIVWAYGFIHGQTVGASGRKWHFGWQVVLWYVIDHYAYRTYFYF